MKKIIHANLNCSDFETSINFYRMLGFVPIIETDVDVDSQEEAAGLNMPPYKLHASPMRLKDGYMIDLIKWIDPYDPEAPYALINHLGISRISLETTNLDADMAFLETAGVEFLSDVVIIDKPVVNSRHVCFKDPDGIIIELVELGDKISGPPNNGGTHIIGALQTHVNCSDFERSRDFYKMIGFVAQAEIEYKGPLELSRAMGTGTCHIREATMTLDKGSSLNLVKWEDPYDASAPYAHLNHLGIARMAIQTTRLEEDIEKLKEAGVAFYTEPITPEPPLDAVTFVCFEDPDGTVIELVKFNN